ncbi:hypothetical protein [Glycomyces lechevalierae]|uniref:Uncharacterized protein n=1 Tax=Glycomyces lechevalierae TaxID=256034 RepID=A0ABU2AHZ3_9ACTN|nr:hypothetical protein [Glycomyces lechevalierae]MDR7336832.1 hypothetical protein [Glycomyces lechevalierae]
MATVPGTGKIGSTSYIGRTKWARAFYDFAVDGGAVGDIALRGDRIPSGAVILDSLVKVDTALTSGGAATVAVKVESAADVNAADAISGAPWSTTGAKRGDLTATTAPVTTTAARTITATVATAALTAGKFSVAIAYVELT